MNQFRIWQKQRGKKLKMLRLISLSIKIFAIFCPNFTIFLQVFGRNFTFFYDLVDAKSFLASKTPKEGVWTENNFSICRDLEKEIFKILLSRQNVWINFAVILFCFKNLFQEHSDLFISVKVISEAIWLLYWFTLPSPGGPRLPLLFTSHSYHHLEGPFLDEMAGQQTGLKGRETKLAWMTGQKISSYETSRGH